MKPRTFVTFEADFPEDGKWDSEGNLVVPGGLAVANAIVSAIRAAGLPATDPMQHNFYGWSFEFTRDAVAAWCVLQFPGPWMLQIQHKGKWLAKLLAPILRPAFERVLDTVDGILKADGRFSAVQWLTRDEYEST